MTRKFYIIKHNESGPTYKIPVCADDFVNDAIRFEEEFENNVSEDEKAAAWMAAEYEQQLLEIEKHY